MKFSENSLVVDVIKISNSSYKLSVPAGDLLTAAMNGAVLRRHDLSTAAVPNVLYVPLSEAKLSSGTYTFTFASGDKFTASTADAYPAASSVSDETGGGSGGGVLVVNVTISGNTMTLDKTWQEIHDSSVPVFGTARTDVGDVSWAFCTDIFEDEGDFVVTCVLGTQPRDFTAASADGYPSATLE